MHGNLGPGDRTVLSEQSREVAFGHAGKEWADIKRLSHCDKTKGANARLRCRGRRKDVEPRKTRWRRSASAGRVMRRGLGLHNACKAARASSTSCSAEYSISIAPVAFASAAETIRTQAHSAMSPPQRNVMATSRLPTDSVR